MLILVRLALLPYSSCEGVMQAPKNNFKKHLLAGEILNGFWLSLASPVTSEALSLVGFDW